MEVAIIGAAAAVLVATLGAVLAHFSSQRLARRTAQLSRINQQLSDLYGPMFATLESNKTAYRAFLRLHRGGAEKFHDPTLEVPSEELKAIWRIWVAEIIQPGNRRVAELVKTQAHLLIDDEIPVPLLKFCAHVASWDAVIRQWEQGDVDQSWSGIPHPGAEVDDYARRSLKLLKVEQQKLLALTAGR